MHLLISAFIGAIIGLVFGADNSSYGRALSVGLLYSAVWWGLGLPRIMPALMGMPAA